jgi:hypothetical protein
MPWRGLVARAGLARAVGRVRCVGLKAQRRDVGGARERRSQVSQSSQPYLSGATVYWVNHAYDLVGRVLRPRSRSDLNEGYSIVYQWDAVDLKDPESLYAEFHRHTPPVDNVGDLMFYRKATGGTERGTLVAPFTGIHGWYLRNDGEEAIVVRLKVAGFYELLEQ